jgi:hypothetical protein
MRRVLAEGCAVRKAKSRGSERRLRYVAGLVPLRGRGVTGPGGELDGRASTVTVESKLAMNARRPLALTLLAVAALLLALVPSRARTQPTPHPVIARFAGTYENRSPDAGRAIIKEAIDSGTRSMRRVRRNVARRRLRAVNPPVPGVTIRPDGAGLRIRYEESRENRTPRLGVFAENRAADGGEVDVKHLVVGGLLHEVYRERQGGAVNVFELSEDRRRLLLHVTIESDQLPGPIRYSLEFARSRR